MGAFGKEAIQLCIFLAEFGDESCYSVSLQRIYQRPSVRITAKSGGNLKKIDHDTIAGGGEEAMPLKKMFRVGSNSDVWLRPEISCVFGFFSEKENVKNSKYYAKSGPMVPLLRYQS
jgi:hypothetical protein